MAERAAHAEPGAAPTTRGVEAVAAEGRADGLQNAAVIVAPLGYFASMPFVLELIERLAAAGRQVHVVTVDTLDPPYEPRPSGVVVHHAPRARSAMGRVAGLLWTWRTLRRLLADGRNRHLFGLSQLGLVLAWLADLPASGRLVYLNDELWFDDHERPPFYALRKFLECRASRRARLVVTQDRDRGRLLARLNRLPVRSLAYLPNSRGGQAARRRTTLIHRLLGEPPETRIVLWMGAVSEGDGSLQIAQQAVHWPEDYLFVYHFRSKSPSPYKQRLMALAGVGRNRIIDHSFAPHEVEDAYASAHVGVVFYPSRGLNAEYIGASSGKLNMFLKAGVPCLVSRSRGLRWAVREAGCEAIADTGDLLPAIRRIEADYDGRAARAVATYNARLTFDLAFGRLMLRLEPPGSRNVRR